MARGRRQGSRTQGEQGPITTTSHHAPSPTPPSLTHCPHGIVRPSRGTGATCHWFFFRDDPRERPCLGLPVINALYQTLRYHLGSVAFAALLVALVQSVRVVLEAIDQQAKRLTGDNPLVKFALNVTRACLWLFDKTVKFVSGFALIFVALNGDSFCVACKDTFHLVTSHPAQVALNQLVQSLLFVVQSILIPLVCALAAQRLVAEQLLPAMLKEASLLAQASAASVREQTATMSASTLQIQEQLVTMSANTLQTVQEQTATMSASTHQTVQAHVASAGLRTALSDAGATLPKLPDDGLLPPAVTHALDEAVAWVVSSLDRLLQLPPSLAEGAGMVGQGAGPEDSDPSAEEGGEAAAPDGLYPALAVLLISFVVSRSFASVLECTVETTFVCAMHDRAEYGAVHMSDALREALQLETPTSKAEGGEGARQAGEGRPRGEGNANGADAQDGLL